MLINEIVNPSNATIFYLDAILFDRQPIFDACEAIIQFNIEKLIDETGCCDLLTKLPFNNLLSLCKDDRLHIRDEQQLLHFIDHYL